MPVWVAAMIWRKPFSPIAASVFEVALDHRLERLRVPPLRMLRRQRLHPIDRERELEIDRLLGPERAVVVEGGDALLDRNEIRPALLGHAIDEGDDRLLRRTLVPGRQRIGFGRLRPDAGEPTQCQRERQRQCRRERCGCRSVHVCASYLRVAAVGRNAALHQGQHEVPGDQPFGSAGLSCGRPPSSMSKSGSRIVLPWAPKNAGWARIHSLGFISLA